MTIDTQSAQFVVAGIAVGTIIANVAVSLSAVRKLEKSDDDQEKRIAALERWQSRSEGREEAQHERER